MAGEEGRQPRRDLALPERHRRGEADLSARLGQRLAHRRRRLLGLVHHALAALVERLAHLGEAHLARGPAQELRAEPALEPRHLPAHRGVGQAEPRGRRGEAARRDDLGEQHHRRGVQARGIFSHEK
jgi:hypothetical protein